LRFFVSTRFHLLVYVLDSRNSSGATVMMGNITSVEANVAIVVCTRFVGSVPKNSADTAMFVRMAQHSVASRCGRVMYSAVSSDG
jgi:hypothetical protein